CCPIRRRRRSRSKRSSASHAPSSAEATRVRPDRSHEEVCVSVLIAFAVPVFLGLIVLEAVLAARRRGAVRGYERRDTFASLAMGIGNVLVRIVTKAWALALYEVVALFAIFEIEFSWWVLPLLIVCEDFCYYWFHRLHHEVRFLWAAHVNHHSSTRYNLSTAL